MTSAQKITRTKILLDSDPKATDEVVSEYLEMASETILWAMYPWGYEIGTTVPAIYEGLQCEMAAWLFSQRGALGEVTHNENGINRTWESPDGRALLRRVTPVVKVV